MDKQEQAAQEKMDAVVAITMAKVAAMEFALAAVIATHPNAVKALAIWDVIRLEPADQSFDLGSALPHYQEQMAKSLAMWSNGFRGAAEMGQAP